MQIDERVAKLETEVSALKEDINEIKQTTKDIQNKINGYLENRVRTIIKSMLGEILIAVISSSAFITFLITKLLK